jgi:hypothetical protein
MTPERRSVKVPDRATSSPAHSSGSVIESGSSWVSKSMKLALSARQAGCSERGQAVAVLRSKTPRRRQQLDDGVARADTCLACGAAAPQREIAEDRNVLERRDGVPAGRAVRARPHEVEHRRLGQFFATHLGTLRLPIALHHLRQALDHDVQE